MADGERVLEELHDLGFGLQFVRAIGTFDTGRWFIAGHGTPIKVIRSRSVLDQRREASDCLEFSAFDVEALRSEIEFVCRHGFGGLYQQLFILANLTVCDGSDRGCRLWRRLGLRSRGRRRSPRGLRQGPDGKSKNGQQTSGA